jgi:cyclopropane fatty-acyl-phospholipid synthase-like methyltransferase
MRASEFDYVERPKQFARTDFWRQVRRTIKGVPVTQEQIQLIVKQIVMGLTLDKNDSLLDIGCGNGALTAEIEHHVSEVLGLDYSEYLVGVAKEYFESAKVQFLQKSIEEMITGELNAKYNKVLLYGVSSYLNDNLLQNLIRWYFSNRQGCLFIGNVRDKSAASKFYNETKSDEELEDHTTSIGKWRTQQWFESLAQDIGVSIDFMKMPRDFYLSDFYFDVVLERFEEP